jgi:putative endonuclease
VRPDPPAPEATTSLVGRRGEDSALAHLQAQGLELIGRNYRCRGGEIDLVMRDGAVLVLVEVRLRSRADFGGAAATIDSRKQRRITLAARHLLQARPELRRMRARFDVVAIDPAREPGAPPVITWIRNAFLAS